MKVLAQISDISYEKHDSRIGLPDTLIGNHALLAYAEVACTHLCCLNL